MTCTKHDFRTHFVIEKEDLAEQGLKPLSMDGRRAVCNNCGELERFLTESEIRKIIDRTKPCGYAQVETCTEDCEKLWKQGKHCNDCIHVELKQKIEARLNAKEKAN